MTDFQSDWKLSAKGGESKKKKYQAEFWPDIPLGFLVYLRIYLRRRLFNQMQSCVDDFILHILLFFVPAAQCQ